MTSKHTQGPARLEYRAFGGDSGIHIKGDNIPTVRLPNCDILVASLGATIGETRDYAELVKEAVNTKHETGLTPRQLAEKIVPLREAHEVLRQSWDESLTEVERQRDVLLAALKAIASCEQYFPGDVVAVARAAIAKVNGAQ